MIVERVWEDLKGQKIQAGREPFTNLMIFEVSNETSTTTLKLPEDAIEFFAWWFTDNAHG